MTEIMSRDKILDGLIIQKEFTCEYMYMTMLTDNENRADAGFPICVCRYYANDIQLCGKLIVEDNCPINKG